VLLVKITDESGRQAFIDRAQHEKQSGKRDIRVNVLAGTARAVPLSFTQQVAAEDHSRIAGVGARPATPGRCRKAPPDLRGPDHHEFQRLSVPRAGCPPRHPQQPVQSCIRNRPRLKGSDHTPVAQHVLELHPMLLSDA